VLPFVKQHNTVLLANHGIICWADTVTHAEWYAEVLETYCWTLMLAAQLGVPISHISEQQGLRPAGHQEEAWPARHPLRYFEDEGVPTLRS
jgi:ribulose-5-phosphate 4-epimerase/fuculose-1-phosphate aldolase